MALCRIIACAALLVAGCGTERDLSAAPDCNGAVRAYARLCGRTATSEDLGWQRLEYEHCSSYTSYEPNSEKQYEAFDKAKAWVTCVLGAASCEAADACPQ